MDYELLFALIILWSATTTCLVLFFLLVFNRDDHESAFHPHCVDVESRHNGFIVVKACTTCKPDCAVKSISAFIAPRGSSSSKYFGSILVIISVAGMFGSFRWFMMGDADETEAVLSVLGFSFLLLICAFESDVSPDRFLEDKLMVTAWFLERMGADTLLDFPLDVDNAAYRYFVRSSPRLRPLFEEFDRDRATGAEGADNGVLKVEDDFPYRPWWAVIHMVGALAYLGCVAASIILNDVDDADIYGVAYVMVASFALFSIMGYLTGTYMPLMRPLRGLILVWNPYCRDKNYRSSLREAVLEYKLAGITFSAGIKTPSGEDKLRRRSSTRLTKRSVDAADIGSTPDRTPGRHDKMIEERRSSLIQVMEEHSSREKSCNVVVRTIYRYIEEEPENYLRYASSLFVVLELVAMLTPAVAIGLQWVTALCPGPPMQSILELATTTSSCMSLTTAECEILMGEHCILRM